MGNILRSLPVGEKVGIGFCFAPTFHPAMKAVKDVRKSLNVPTCFNILGPLLNPANAEYLLVGVFNEELMNLMAEVLFDKGVKRALVFHSNGLDELSCIGPARVLEITSSEIKPLNLDPETFGLPKCTIGDLRGGSAKENAATLLAVFNGKPGPIANTLIFNAAVALYIYGISSSIEAAVPLVKNSIKDGKALKILNDFITFTQEAGDHE